MARPALAAGPAIGSVEWKLLPATVGATPSIAARPTFMSSGGARRRRRSGFALQADRAAARVEHLHQPLREHAGLWILSHAGAVLEKVQGAQNIRPLPWRQSHTLFISVDLG
jgi:hypothetical protein